MGGIRMLVGVVPSPPFRCLRPLQEDPLWPFFCRILAGGSFQYQEAATGPSLGPDRATHSMLLAFLQASRSKSLSGPLKAHPNYRPPRKSVFFFFLTN